MVLRRVVDVSLFLFIIVFDCFICFASVGQESFNKQYSDVDCTERSTLTIHTNDFQAIVSWYSCWPLLAWNAPRTVLSCTAHSTHTRQSIFIFDKNNSHKLCSCTFAIRASTDCTELIQIQNAGQSTFPNNCSARNEFITNFVFT